MHFELENASGKTKATAALPASPLGTRAKISHHLASDISFGIRRACAGHLKKVFQDSWPSPRNATSPSQSGSIKQPLAHGIREPHFIGPKIQTRCGSSGNFS